MARILLRGILPTFWFGLIAFNFVAHQLSSTLDFTTEERSSIFLWMLILLAGQLAIWDEVRRIRKRLCDKDLSKGNY